MERGKKRLDIEMPPVTGKAVPVYKGEILRITQVDGGQCVDFNCFNLHDYKEHMSVGHIRRQGLRFVEGHIIWSAPPRLSPMMYGLKIPESCVTDVLAARCNAPMFEMIFGIHSHTNCTDTFAEAIGEFGLTPDDIHDSLNMWMNTGLSEDGRATYHWNTGIPEEPLELLAMMDVLAVPIVCGSGDIMPTSNFTLKPISIQIYEESTDSNKQVQELEKEYRSLRSQKTLDQFRTRDIKTDRELRPISDYKPNFVNYPLVFRELEINFSEKDLKDLEFLREKEFPGTDEEVILASVMMWIRSNRRNKDWALYNTGVKI